MGARSARSVFRLFLIISAASVLYVCSPLTWHVADYVRQTHPFSGQHEIQQKFTATDEELACLNGTPLPSESAWSYSPSPWPDSALDTRRRRALDGDIEIDNDNDGDIDDKPIPNKVHFIFGLKNPMDHRGVGRFDFLSYLAVRSAIVSLEPDAIYLHYTFLSEPPSPNPHADPLTNPWIRRLARDITLVHHDPAPGGEATQYAHLSDTMRLEFLLEQGGIYLDIDSFALRPFGGLLRAPRPRDIVLGAEGGNRWGLCNAIMAARPNSSFVARWLESYRDADLRREWNYHSVILPQELARAHPSEVCRLAPDAFFWPTWTWRHIEWMHEPLPPDEAEFWEAEIRNNSGSLFPNQVAYHAWNQMAWDRHLKKLTPTLVRQRDTRFNLLVRRFLEDDLA